MKQVCTEEEFYTELEVGDMYEAWINQGYRPCTVLAVLDNQALVEYQMPKGTSALFLVTMDNSNTRGISYFSLPERWVKAILEAGSDWIGRPQQSRATAVINSNTLKVERKY